MPQYLEYAEHLSVERSSRTNQNSKLAQPPTWNPQKQVINRQNINVFLEMPTPISSQYFLLHSSFFSFSLGYATCRNVSINPQKYKQEEGECHWLHLLVVQLKHLQTDVLIFSKINKVAMPATKSPAICPGSREKRENYEWSIFITFFRFQMPKCMF